MYALVMAMCPPVEGHGKLVRGDGAHDPVPLLLEGVGAQEVACQLSLQGWKQEEVCWSQVRTVGVVVQHLDALLVQEGLDGLGRMDRGIVPMEQPAFAQFFGS